MSSYKIDGFKFDRANLRGMDASISASLERYMTAREREINTVELESLTCSGGPFDGQVLELCDLGTGAPSCTAEFTVAGQTGRYVRMHPLNDTGQLDTSRCAAIWVPAGTAAGTPTPGVFVRTQQPKKAAAEKPLGRGFARLAQFVAGLAVADSGARVTFAIGRARYTIANTPEAIDRLRAKILKNKKWFADKFLPADVPTMAAQIPAPVYSQAAADAIAQAMAAAVIEQAQQADNTPRKMTTVCEAAGADRAAPMTTGRTSSHSAGPAHTTGQGGTGQPPTWHTLQARPISTGGAHGDGPDQTPAVPQSETPQDQAPRKSSPTAARMALADLRAAIHRGRGQRVASKSDAWEAWIYTNVRADGFTWFNLVFFAGRAQNPTRHLRYKTRRDTLQALARFAAPIDARTAIKPDQTPHDYTAGDVLVSSWGYDQTNIDYYQVTKVIGKRTLEVRKLRQEVMPTGDMNGRCVPLVGEFDGEPMRRLVSNYGRVNVLQASYGQASKAEFQTIAGMRVYPGHAWSSWA